MTGGSTRPMASAQPHPLPHPHLPRLSRWRVALAAAAAALLASCSTPPKPLPPLLSPPPQAVPAPPAAPLQAAPWPAAAGTVAGRHERLLVYLPADGDTLAGIAARFLASATQAWQIAEANDQRWEVLAGQPLVVPLVNDNPLGISADGAQAVPILCYHRFGMANSKMMVSPAQFEAQLDWLAREHYQVLRLSELADFLAGRRALPQRAVVITIDDGYESMLRHALPVLKKHGFPATLFVYTDFIGARDALGWGQLEDLARTGLVDLQAHSKSHRNLARQEPGESDVAYQSMLDLETRQPRALLERRLAASGVQVRYFAYPYGDANDAVLQAVQRHNYALGLTVNPGSNPFFAHPYLLRRTMIFGDMGLDDFKARLKGRRSPGR